MSNTIINPPRAADGTTFAGLREHQYMLLTTFRRNGAGVATPVWFAAGEGRLYVFTIATAGKLKRIRHTPHVLVAPCSRSGTPLGPALSGQARILAPGAEHAAVSAFRHKYGLLKRMFDLAQRMSGRTAVYLEILPQISPLPDSGPPVRISRS